MMGLLLSIVVLASIYALIAVAWVMIFRATGVPNFATGTMVLLGALVFYSFYSQMDMPFVVSLVLALAVGVLIAVLAQRIVNPLVGQPLWSPVMLTFGLTIVLTAVISMIWSGTPRQLPRPVEARTFTLEPFGYITVYGIAAVVVCSVFFAVLLVFLRWSRLGTQMRAVADSPHLASHSGIRVGRVALVSWAIAGVASVLAGILYGYSNIVSFDMAQLGLRGIVPALVGGFDSVKGALVGALIVAFVELNASSLLGGQSQDIAAYVVLLAVLVVKPYGLFGTKEIRRV